ncbi:hypothetical protein [Bradyrhizobium neotropicale]|uniref:hypothetical protein n=1 Tax=Bradyrhizobium neotropicale TaxID=1497615 RepID=UPI000AA7A823|nr:hypothetical protein [Bradyrhizobium neotropicale]
MATHICIVRLRCADWKVAGASSRVLEEVRVDYHQKQRAPVALFPGRASAVALRLRTLAQNNVSLAGGTRSQAPPSYSSVEGRLV